MNSAERPDFDKQIELLTASFNVPPMGARGDAYFIGLSKMTLPAFIRVVEFCLSESAPEKFPSVRKVWDIHRQLRAPGAQQIAVAYAKRQEAEIEQRRLDEQGFGYNVHDDWETEANLMMMRLSCGLARRISIKTPAQARACWVRVRSIAKDFSGLAKEADPEATVQRMYQAIHDAMKQAIKETPDDGNRTAGGAGRAGTYAAAPAGRQANQDQSAAHRE